MSGKNKFYLKIIVFALTVIISSTERRRRLCSNQGLCNKDQFTCSNEVCVKREEYCDGDNDCGDNSDEEYCGSQSSSNSYNRNRNYRVVCSSDPPFTRCGDSNKCIPNEWLCDGRYDCPSGEDERNCARIHRGRSTTAKQKALNWVFDRTFNESTLLKMDSYIHKAAVALFLSETPSNESYFQLNMAKDVTIHFLSSLYQKNLSDIPSTDLAAFVNAMLITCLNPRKFYGMNLVNELRVRVDNQNYSNPYVLLTLCNAGDTITEMDTKKLEETFRHKHREFWTDMQAMVVMALSCAAKQPGSPVDETLKEFTDELKSRQYRNGSVEDVKTTALVLQALYSAEPDEDPDNFDEQKALQQILAHQEPDGSFGNFMKTYYVLPVLNCMSLVNITSDHCEFTHTDETSALQDLANRAGPKILVRYSLWFGDQKYLERTLALRVPANMSFYGIMEIAAEIDNRYRFEYKVRNRKPYVSGISGQLDDPETGKFWFLHILKNEEPSPIDKSPADVMPKENDHFVMWYRSGSWID